MKCKELSQATEVQGQSYSATPDLPNCFQPPLREGYKSHLKSSVILKQQVPNSPTASRSRILGLFRFLKGKGRNIVQGRTA